MEKVQIDQLFCYRKYFLPFPTTVSCSPPAKCSHLFCGRGCRGYWGGFVAAGRVQPEAPPLPSWPAWDAAGTCLPPWETRCQWCHHGAGPKNTPVNNILCLNEYTFHCEQSYSHILTNYLWDSPAKRPQLVQGPFFSYRSVREADPVPGEKSLRCMQLGTGPSCHSFQNISGRIKPCPCLVRI